MLNVWCTQICQNPTKTHVLVVRVARFRRFSTDLQWWKCASSHSPHGFFCVYCVLYICCQAEEERDGMEKVKLDNRRILFNLLPAHVAQHFLMSNPRNMVSLANRQAGKLKDKQVDKKAENQKWRTSEVTFCTVILHFFMFFIRICTINPTHK